MPYHKTPVHLWHKTAYSEHEKKRIIEVYSQTHRKGPGHHWVSDLAKELGRPAGNISRFARSLGLTNGPKVFPTSPCVVCGVSVEKRRKRKTCGKICSSKLLSESISVISNNPEYKKMVSERSREWIKKHGHPRGMKGKNHSDKFKKEASVRVKAMWADPKSKVNSEEFRQRASDRQSIFQTKRMRNHTSAYSRCHNGWREYSNGKKFFLRSKWEMNYGFYLDFLLKNNEIVDWDYEADTFWFEKIKRGVRSYTPDFKITNNDGSTEYHEVKGWMDPKSVTKLKRMKKYHPHITIYVIDEPVYKAIKSKAAIVPGWE